MMEVGVVCSLNYLIIIKINIVFTMYQCLCKNIYKRNSLVEKGRDDGLLGPVK